MPSTGVQRSRAPASPWTAADLLALSDERDAWQRVALAREAAAWHAGYLDGIEAGRDIQRRADTAGWRDLARRAQSGLPFSWLERRRWGPGGRAHFADPRPGDHPGQQR